ncbi:MAG: protein kinase [Candidatus Brocadiae bacterium]|nr:protein kinase [Candidatus Brocadiia bacterium]
MRTISLKQILLDAYEENLISFEILETLGEYLSLQKLTEDDFWKKVYSLSPLTLDDIEKLKNRQIPIDADIPQAKYYTDLNKILDEFTGISRLGQVRQEFFSLGRYEILEELGSGGLGIVYKAYDKNLERIVALKISQKFHQESERFLIQAKLIAALKIHANIVPIYDVGLTPYPYFTMEYIQGQTLSSFIQQNKNISFNELTNIFLLIVEAVSYTHENGIVHRDIKPSNIMITEKFDTKIMDFGLANIIDSTLSKSGYLIGTPQYMPPERIDPVKFLGKEQSFGLLEIKGDIYCLGATFYEMLTKKTLFEGKNFSSILLQILHNEPIEPARLNPDIPDDLNAICIKCIEKNPSKRYNNARELAMDLDNYIHNKPILAKSPTSFTRFKKFILRNKLLVVSSCLIFLTIISGSLVSFIQWQKAETNLYETQILLNKNFLEKSQSLRKEKQYFAARMTAERTILRTHGRKKIFFQEGTPEQAEVKNIIQDSPDIRILWQSPRNRHHSVPIAHLTCSKEKPFLLSSGTDGSSCLWNTETGKKISEYSFQSQNISKALFLDEEQRIISASYDGSIVLIDIPSKKELYLEERDTVYIKSIHDMVFDSNTRTLIALLTKEKDCFLHIWDMFSQLQQPKIISLSHKANILAYCNQKKILAIGGKSIAFYQIPSCKLAEIPIQAEKIQGMSFSPQGDILAISDLNSLTLWEFPGGKKIETFSHSISSSNALAFSEDGYYLAWAEDKKIMLWDKKNIVELQGHKSPIKTLCFRPDSKALFSAGDDTLIHSWEIPSGKKICAFKNTITNIYRACFHPTGLFIASTEFRNPSLQIWNVQKKEVVKNFSYDDTITAISFDPDGKIMAIALQKGDIVLQDFASGKILHEMKGHSGAVFSLSFHPKQNILASGGTDNTIQIWDVSTAKKINQWKAHDRYVYCIEFSPDGTYLASCGEDALVHFWDIQEGKCLYTFPMNTKKIYDVTFDKGQITSQSEHAIKVYALAFQPQGEFFATADGEGKIHLWTLPEKKLLYTFNSSLDTHTGTVKCLAFSPDGRTLASGSNDNSIKIWKRDGNKWLNVTTLKEDFGEIFSLQYAPDSKTLLSATSQGNLTLWIEDHNKEYGYLMGNRMSSSVRFSPDGRMVASGFAIEKGQSLYVWDWESRKEKKMEQTPSHFIKHIDFSPDGKILAAGSQKGYIYLWDMESGKIVQETSAHKDDVTALAFHPSGKFLASLGADYLLKIWSIPECRLMKTLCGPKDMLQSFCFNPDGKTLLTSSYKGTMAIWDTKNYTLLHKLHGDKYYITTMTYSPDGKMLASAFSDVTIKIWDMESMKITSVLKGYKEVICSLAFSPNGKFLIASGGDYLIKVWEMPSGKEDANLIGDTGIVHQVVFNPDGTVMAGAGCEGRVIFWKMPRETFDLEEYLQLYYFDDFELKLKTGYNRNPYLYSSDPGYEFSIPENSYLSILKKNISWEEKKKELAFRYRVAHSHKAAELIAKQKTTDE